MNIMDFVSDRSNTVQFDYYRLNVMYYKVWSVDKTKVYRFPVRLDPEDIGEATLLSHDKAITFMRYIRKAIGNNELVEII